MIEARPHPLARIPLPRIAVLPGLLWSLFGAVQFARQTFADREGLIAGGMTTAQADLYAGLPLWMDAAFGIGTLGGVLGCGLLLAGRRLAVAVLGISLAAYLALYAGDIALGVFAAFGAPQVTVLTIVVAVAAALLWLARRMERQGRLA